MTEHEEWRPIPGFEGYYEVSDLGRVRTVERVVPAGVRGGVRTIPAAPRRLVVRSNGYAQVTLQRRSLMVHTLVARAFLGPRPDDYEVCHNNGDPLDNRLANLRYDTRSANRLDTVAHGHCRASERTHCPKNHPYDEANTAIVHGKHRRCRACHRISERDRRSRAND